MSRFGWAYVNELITGSVGTGPTNSVQFNTGSGYLSGTSNFLFDPSTSKLTLLGLLSGSTLTISASAISASTYYGITGGGGTPGGSNTAIQFNSGSSFSGSNNFTFDYITNTMYLTGTLRADNIIVSSSQILKSGSTIFGDDAGDTHQFTGSVYLKNNLSVSGAAEVTGNLKSLGQISSSLDLATNSNVTAVGNITTTGGSLSASSGVNTNGTMFAASHITSNGIMSSSGGVNTNGPVYAAGGVTSPLNIATSASMYVSSSYVSGNLYVSGTSFLGPISSTGNISGSGFTGNGFGLTGIQGYNVDGVGDDWAVQYKDGNTGTLTGSSNFIASGSVFTVSGTVSASSFAGDPYGGFNMLGKRILYIQANDTSSNFIMTMPGGGSITNNGISTFTNNTNNFMRLLTTATAGNSARAITQGGWCRTGHTGKIRGGFVTGTGSTSQTISFGLSTDDSYNYNSGGQAILLTYDSVSTSGNFVLYTRDSVGNTSSVNTGIAFSTSSTYSFEIGFDSLTASCTLNGTTIYNSSSLPTASVDLRARFGIRTAVTSAVDMYVKYFSLATGI